MSGTIGRIEWQRIDPWRTPDGLPCALGGGLDPECLLDAFRAGYFPMPTERLEQVEINQIVYTDHVEMGTITMLPTAHPLGPYAIVWWNPARRPVFAPGQVRLSGDFRRQLRNKLGWTTTCNSAFERVVAECAADRPPNKQWLSDNVAESMVALHHMGWAHSVEVWEGEHLISGVVGLGFGGVFSMDTTFYRRSGGSKVAIADLQARLADSGNILLDAQMRGPLAEGLGAQLVDRRTYLDALGDIAQPVQLDTEPKPASWIATVAELSVLVFIPIWRKYGRD